ncbi:hypothetical protein BDQ17DRAFT_1349122 [Cyathus striatus]|nr:hypothetical protein BDQ17DRAFT_1349122 [Cyathus striatus]
MCPQTDICLKFSYSSCSTDIRAFEIHQLLPDNTTAEMYKFHHPTTGFSAGVTTVTRKNLNTNVFETAVEIDWKSNINATIYFGVEEIPVGDLRRFKKTSSSRRFKAARTEYKWKQGSNENLHCVDLRGKEVATWIQDRYLLCISPKLEDILDHIVVTCLLNQWFRHLGRW